MAEMQKPAISIHALREEGDGRRFYVALAQSISIHALREEGDTRQSVVLNAVSTFLSTPSARRATTTMMIKNQENGHFYPRPPRGGRLLKMSCEKCRSNISIHALREEGDFSALRLARHAGQFLSTPSARRATSMGTTAGWRKSISIHALREEGDAHRPEERAGPGGISIHALREEGDPSFGVVLRFCPISIHALREEGDNLPGLIT